MIRRQLRLFSQDRQSLFWSFLFPLILATFFQLALSNLSGNVPIETIDIAYLNQSVASNSFTQFDSFINSVETEEGPLFNVVTVSDNEEALAMLDSHELTVLVDVSSDEFPLTIKSESIKQSVAAQVIESYLQNTQTITSILTRNPQLDVETVLSTLTSESTYFESNSDENTSYNTIYFYALIGMQAMYGSLWGLKVMNQNEANQSTKGMRVQVSPVPKAKLIFSGLIASVILHFVSMILLLGFLMFVLKVEFGNQLGAIAFISFLGSMAGVSMGLFIGASSRASFDSKIGMSIAISMVMSALSGMMYSGMDLLVKQNVPILATINPITQISQALQSLHYYNNLDLYWLSVRNLSLIIVVLISLSIFFTRRKQYDSL
ncbi:MAG: ABC transporter permease [Erysipelothrix sp.]|nr:ABC transporter permease [Erysipelothrix sp.]